MLTEKFYRKESAMVSVSEKQPAWTAGKLTLHNEREKLGCLVGFCPAEKFVWFALVSITKNKWNEDWKNRIRFANMMNDLGSSIFFIASISFTTFHPSSCNSKRKEKKVVIY